MVVMKNKYYGGLGQTKPRTKNSFKHVCDSQKRMVVRKLTYLVHSHFSEAPLLQERGSIQRYASCFVFYQAKEFEIHIYFLHLKKSEEVVFPIVENILCVMHHANRILNLVTDF